MSSSEMDPIDSSPKHETCSESKELLDLLRGRFEVVQELLEQLIGLTQAHDPVERSNNFANTITAIFKEKHTDTPICIFKVPDSQTSAKPEAYVPQLIGLGPIHYLRPGLQHMQMYKVAEAKRIHYGFQSDLKFDRIIEFLKRMAASHVRASYNTYLEMEDDVLACIMVVDGLFLFNLLCGYGINKEALENSISLCHLVKSSERRLALETTIQVAMMLENQIPIFVLKVILILECWPPKKEIVSDLLPKILLGFCEFFSPLKTVKNYPLYKALKHAHLLDLLYHLVVLKHSPEYNHEEEKVELSSIDELSRRISGFIRPKRHAICCIEQAAAGIQKFTELGQGLLGLPWSQVRLSIASALEKEGPEKEIFIPRASELRKAGVKFSVADHITDIDFNRNTISFCLPVIKINANFEVIIRNLVVYEAMIKSEKEPPILNWYVELMNGLIQTAEDVGVLKAKGIISTESIDEEQVAKIFSGMNKSVELTNIPSNLDNAVKDINKYYNDVWWVSTFKFMKRGWRTTWKWCSVIGALLALFLLAVQTFCSVYGCSRFSFKTSNIPHAHQGLPLPNSLRSHLM